MSNNEPKKIHTPREAANGVPIVVLGGHSEALFAYFQVLNNWY